MTLKFAHISQASIDKITEVKLPSWGSISTILSFFRNNSDTYVELQKQIECNPEYQKPSYLFICINKNIVLPKCAKCGKTITYTIWKKGRRFCSKECSKEENTANAQKTCMLKYGTRTPLQNEQIRKKCQQTSLDKYGKEFFFQSESYEEKRKNTMLEKYGVEYASQNESSKKIIMKKAHKREYAILKERFKNYVDSLFTEEEYHSYNGTYKWKCVKCGNIFEQRIYNTNFNEISMLPRCLNCFPFGNNFSSLEKELADFIKSLTTFKIIENDNKTINQYELDVFIPELKMAFEFNGLYWHSEQCGKDKDYHLNKTKMCEKIGIRLIHIFEDEWNGKKEIVKDRIISLMHAGRKRIHARKCVVKEINALDCNRFLDTNHLQGHDNSSIRYGLFHENELVAVMTFGKPRFNRKYDWELVRFASKLGMAVQGGASKLLSVFEKSHSGTIISYADRRYSNGNSYDRIGFKCIGKSKPNYCWTKQKTRLSRYICQKKKLRRILGNSFDENLTEYENMTKNGYDKIYDCGNLIYVKGVQP